MKSRAGRSTQTSGSKDAGHAGRHAALLDTTVRSLKPRATAYEIRDGLAPGLVLRVLPSGRKLWSVRYRRNGKQKRYVFGDYPGLSLSKAREAAEHARVNIRDGRDPAAEQQARKAPITDTVDTLITTYLDKHARVKKRTADEDDRVLNRYVLPYWRGRSVRDITRPDVYAIIERIADRGAPIMANRALEIVRKMFNFAIRRGLLDGNPAALVDKPGVEKSRDRVLTDDEIRRLWRLLSHFPATEERQAPGRKLAKAPKGDPFCPLSPALAAVQKLRLLTAQRGGEVVRMRWADLDLAAGWWTIPAEHSKNGRPHRVPLVPEAVALIEAQQPDDEEEAPDEAQKPEDDHEKPGEYVFTGRQGALVVERVKKAGAACARALGFEMRSHDLRRTAATRMAAAGIARETISAVLNHVQGGPVATRTYDRYERDAEKRVALETWARALTAIIENRPASAVVPMRQRKA